VCPQDSHDSQRTSLNQGIHQRFDVINAGLLPARSCWVERICVSLPRAAQRKNTQFPLAVPDATIARNSCSARMRSARASHLETSPFAQEA